MASCRQKRYLLILGVILVSFAVIGGICTYFWNNREIIQPTVIPTVVPTVVPTVTPTVSPTATPTPSPTPIPPAPPTPTPHGCCDNCYCIQNRR